MMTWAGTCAVCGNPVAGGTDNGTLDIPAEEQAVICLRCIAFGHKEPDKAGIPHLVKRELREADDGN